MNLRTRADAEQEERERLAPYAEKRGDSRGRLHPEPEHAYRTAFARDRDRILWSPALRRLANKTQLFPVGSDDNLRQRLAHSIEVNQLASTIGANFGLDPDLIAAGALAHDIGHTPFGHAGRVFRRTDACARRRRSSSRSCHPRQFRLTDSRCSASRDSSSR